MLYSEVIPRLDHELRDEEAWPDDTSKILEQINLLYNAALAVGREIPLGRLSLTETSSPLSATSINTNVDRYDLNESGVNIFDLRYSPDIGVTDMGIATLRLDGNDYLPSQGITRESLLALANNSIHSGRVLFAIDYPNEQIYAMNVTTLNLYYAQKFIRPTYDAGSPDPNTDYTNLDWPLSNDTDTERAIHIVAAHVSGVTIKDPAGAQFHALLEQTYGG